MADIDDARRDVLYAIDQLATKARKADTPPDALTLSKAALNLGELLAQLRGI